MDQRALILEDQIFLRRAGQSTLGNSMPETLRAGNIELDPERRTVKTCGHLVHLTPKEFDLAQQLMSHVGRPIRHRLLLSAVWGSVYGAKPEYLRTYMRQ